MAKGRALMSPYEGTGAEAEGGAAVRVGSDLRAARERLGWTLPAIAAHLRIRLAYLEALEDGRIADLPAIAYAAGFLRTYAQALGLDPSEMGRRFRAEAAEANRKTELNFPAPVPDRGVPAGAVVLVGALLAVGAYIGWYRMSESGRPTVETVQPVPDRLAPLAEKVAPLAPAPAATPKPEPMGAPPAASPAVSPSSAAAAVAPPAFQPSPVAAAQPATVAAAAEAPKPTGPRILLRAKTDAWMQVRERGGQVLLNRVLRSGETWPVPDRPSLLLTTGNAGGTELVVDGTTTTALGGEGAVRRDLPLDPDAIKSGRLTPPPRRP